MQEDDLLIFLKLSRAGYGSLAEVEQMDAHHILQAVNYEKFLSEFEASFVHINSGDN